ncbi:MAG TPA: hypothetical protein VGQ29_02395, partial [Gemmatimonadales bacterium]|nr:hypothetical protein [Gemmatimonadales bacterium]
MVPTSRSAISAMVVFDERGKTVRNDFSQSPTGTLRLEGTITGHQQFSISRGAILDGTVTGVTKMNISSASVGSKPMVMTSD